MEERHILAAMESQWLTRLVASFQDEVNLYLVMEFIPGGDLGTILMKADEGLLTIDEPFARFYIAETALALRDLHQLNFVHRYAHICSICSMIHMQ
jgi:serine/threonine kinase 38